MLDLRARPPVLRSIALLAPFALASGVLADTYCINYRDYPGRVAEVPFVMSRHGNGAIDALRGVTEYDIAERGDLTFVARGPDGMHIYDRDGFVGSFDDVQVDVYSIALTDDPDCIWVGGLDSVSRVDVSDPVNPMVIETIVLPNSSKVDRLSYSNNTLLAHGEGDSYRVRLAGPCGPKLGEDAITNVVFASIGSDLENGIAAFVGTNSLAVGDFDANPPTIVGPTSVPGGVTGVAVMDGRIFVTTLAGLRVYNALLQLLGQNTSVPNLLGIDTARGTDDSDLVVVLDTNGRTHLLDADTFQRRASLAGPSDGVSLSSGGDAITVRRDGSTSVEGLGVYRVGGVAAPAPHATFEAVVPVTVQVWRTFIPQLVLLTLFTHSGGMTGGLAECADVTDPTNPTPVDQIDLPAVTKLARFQHDQRRGGAPRGVPSTYFAVGSLLDFKILDATDPANLAIVGSLPGSSSEVAAAEDGSLVLRSTNAPGFQVVDVSDPANPLDRGFVSTPNAINDMVVDGTRAVVATTGLTGRWDVSNPDAPTLEHATGLTGVRSVAASASADRYYLGSTGNGRRIVLYDFATQSELGSVNVGAGRLSVYTHAPGPLTGGGAEFVYASDADRSMFVIDWTDPMNPELLGEYTDPAMVPRGIAATDEVVVLANGAFPGDVLILPAQSTGGGATDAPLVTSAGGDWLGAAWPNPFASSTSIEMMLSRVADVRVDVYDVSGRRVSTLASAELGVGRHVFSWDGRSERGATVANGVYFVRVVAGDVVARKKVVVVR
jgi:hypothetical protein